MNNIPSFDEFVNESYSINEGKDKIYLNRELSDFFDVFYDNHDEKFITHVDALKRNNKEWDKDHKNIFKKYKGKTLNLVGIGYGWWEIINALKESYNKINEDYLDLGSVDTLEDDMENRKEGDEWLGYYEELSKLLKAKPSDILIVSNEFDNFDYDDIDDFDEWYQDVFLDLTYDGKKGPEKNMDANPRSLYAMNFTIYPKTGFAHYQESGLDIYYFVAKKWRKKLEALSK